MFKNVFSSSIVEGTAPKSSIDGGPDKRFFLLEFVLLGITELESMLLGITELESVLPALHKIVSVSSL